MYLEDETGKGKKRQRGGGGGGSRKGREDEVLYSSVHGSFDILYFSFFFHYSLLI